MNREYVYRKHLRKPGVYLSVMGAFILLVFLIIVFT